MKKLIFVLLIIALSYVSLEGYSFIFSTSDESLHGLVLALKAKIRKATHGFFGKYTQRTTFLSDQETNQGFYGRTIANGNTYISVSPETHRPLQRWLLIPSNILERFLIGSKNHVGKLEKIPGQQVKSKNVSRHLQSSR